MRKKLRRRRRGRQPNPSPRCLHLSASLAFLGQYTPQTVSRRRKRAPHQQLLVLRANSPRRKRLRTLTHLSVVASLKGGRCRLVGPSSTLRATLSRCLLLKPLTIRINRDCFLTQIATVKTKRILRPRKATRASGQSKRLTRPK